MGLPKCNNTIETDTIHEVVVSHGLTLHQIGLIAAFAGGVIAIILSVILIMLHALNYRKPSEQKHIIRILIMVPVFAVASFLSFVFYRKNVYFEVLRDLYGAIAIAAFFSLMCHYVASNGLHEQKDYFRQIEPKGWIWPLSTFKKCCGGQRGIWRTPRSGLTWFNIVWLGVFQYVFIRVIFTCIAAVTQAAGVYCQESLNPAFAHVWVICIEALSVLIAMYCIIQFYWQVKEDIGQHSPILQVIAIKLVIFLSFWQTIIISFLTSAGAITSGPRLNQADIKVGFPSFLLCWEMAIFAAFHFWAFSFGPYRRSADPMTTEKKGGFLGIKAIIDALNIWDLIQAVGRSFKWLFVGRKHRMEDASYNKAPVPADETAIDLEDMNTYDDEERTHGKQDNKQPRVPTVEDDQQPLKQENPSYRSDPRNHYAGEQQQYSQGQPQGRIGGGGSHQYPYHDQRQQYSQDQFQNQAERDEAGPYYDQRQYDARQAHNGTQDGRYQGPIGQGY